MVDAPPVVYGSWTDENDLLLIYTYSRFIESAVKNPII